MKKTQSNQSQQCNEQVYTHVFKLPCAPEFILLGTENLEITKPEIVAGVQTEYLYSCLVQCISCSYVILTLSVSIERFYKPLFKAPKGFFGIPTYLTGKSGFPKEIYCECNKAVMIGNCVNGKILFKKDRVTISDQTEMKSQNSAPKYKFDSRAAVLRVISDFSNIQDRFLRFLA